MTSPITEFVITPNYKGGFSYSWKIDPLFIESIPWVFEIQESEAPMDDWKAVSPPLTNQ